MSTSARDPVWCTSQSRSWRTRTRRSSPGAQGTDPQTRVQLARTEWRLRTSICPGGRRPTRSQRGFQPAQALPNKGKSSVPDLPLSPLRLQRPQHHQEPPIPLRSRYCARVSAPKDAPRAPPPGEPWAQRRRVFRLPELVLGRPPPFTPPPFALQEVGTWGGFGLKSPKPSASESLLGPETKQ